MTDLDEALCLIDYQWILPAVVVGFDQRMADAPEVPWLMTLRQQYAGHACLHQSLTGLVLPLAARRDATALMADLEILALDGSADAPFDDRPDLGSLHLCSRAQYLPAQREALDRMLAKGPPLPKVRRAAEALVELDASEPLRFFGGWDVLSLELPRRVHLTDPRARDLVVGPLGLYRHQRLDAPLLEAVRALLPVRLRVFLLWWNSD